MLWIESEFVLRRETLARWHTSCVVAGRHHAYAWNTHLLWKLIHSFRCKILKRFICTFTGHRPRLALDHKHSLILFILARRSYCVCWIFGNPKFLKDLDSTFIELGLFEWPKNCSYTYTMWVCASVRVVIIKLEVTALSCASRSINSRIWCERNTILSP